MLVGPLLGGVLVDTPRLGVDLLHQRAGRHGRRSCWPGGWCRRCRPTRTSSTGSASRSAGSACSCWCSASRRAHQYDWGTIAGPITVWRLIIGGLVVFAVFVSGRRATGASRWCRSGSSATATSRWPTSAISTMSFAFTAMAFPLMLYAQLVRGLSPTEGRAAAGADGGDVDRARARRRQAHRPDPSARDHRGRVRRPRRRPGLAVPGDDPDSAIWEILLPMALIGAGNACIWAPLTATATRNLPMHLAGAGCRGLQRHPPGRRRRSARPRSRCSWTPGSPPNGLVFDPTQGGRQHAARAQSHGAVQRRDGRRRCC